MPRSFLVIDAVDTEEGSISFRLEAGSQALAVFDRTRITLDGQEATLASLKPGHWAYFAYNPERGNLRWIEAFSNNPLEPGS
jgi:hypothetical protein